MPKRPPTAEQDDAMILAYQGGESLRAAARPFSAEYLRLLLIRRGIRPRPKSAATAVGIAGQQAARAERAKRASARHVRIIADYLESRDAVGVAQRFGMHEDTIHRVLRSGGIETGFYKTVNHDYFERVDSEQKAYWLGFLAADGCVQGRKISLLLAGRDREHVFLFREHIGATHAVTEGQHPAGEFTYASLQVTSPKMAGDLAREGVSPLKSLITPAWDGPEHLMRHWFRGLVDGDGHIVLPHDGGSKGNRTYLAVGLCGSEACVRAFGEFGKAVTGVTVKPLRKSQRGLWAIAFSGATAQPLLREMYSGASVSLKRKQLLADAALTLAPRNRTSRHGPPPSSPMA